MQFEGTRSVVLVKYISTLQYLGKTFDAPIDVGDAVASRQRLSNFLRNMTLPQFQEFVKDGNDIYAATVGPNDILHIPAGWYFGERVSREGAASGYRLQLMVNSKCSGAYADAVLRAFGSSGKAKAPHAQILIGFGETMRALGEVEAKKLEVAGGVAGGGAAASEAAGGGAAANEFVNKES